MKKITPAIYIFSFLIAVVIMYWIMIRQYDASHEQALINALAGGLGMLLGLFIYNKLIKKDGDDNPPDAI